MTEKVTSNAADRRWGEVVATATVSAGGSTATILLTAYAGEFLGFYAQGGPVHVRFGPSSTVGAADTSHPPIASEGVEEFRVKPGYNDGVRAIGGTGATKLVVFKAGGGG